MFAGVSGYTIAAGRAKSTAPVQLLMAALIAGGMLLGNAYVAPGGLGGGPVAAGADLNDGIDCRWDPWSCVGGGSGGGGGGGVDDPFAPPIDWGTPADKWGPGSDASCSPSTSNGSAEYGRRCDGGFDVSIGPIKEIKRRPAVNGQANNGSSAGSNERTPNQSTGPAEGGSGAKGQEEVTFPIDYLEDLRPERENRLSTYDQLYPTASEDVPTVQCSDELVDAGASCLDLSPFSCAKDLYRYTACASNVNNADVIVIKQCRTLKDAQEQWCGQDFYDELAQDLDPGFRIPSPSNASPNSAGTTSGAASTRDERGPKRGQRGKGAKGNKGKKRSMIQTQDGDRDDREDRSHTRANDNRGHGKGHQARGNNHDARGKGQHNRGNARGNHGKSKGKGAKDRGNSDHGRGHGNGNHGKGGKRR
jgi:hypothetical protein